MATLKLTNAFDQLLAARGLLEAAEVRETEVEALVDTGATLLVLPDEVVTRLGLDEIDRRPVRYADGRREERAIVGPVRLEVIGRHGNFSAVREKPGTTPLIGQVVLEELDLIVNPGSEELLPDPDSPDAPMVDIF